MHHGSPNRSTRNRSLVNTGSLNAKSFASIKTIVQDMETPNKTIRELQQFIQEDQSKSLQLPEEQIISMLQDLLKVSERPDHNLVKKISELFQAIVKTNPNQPVQKITQFIYAQLSRKFNEYIGDLLIDILDSMSLTQLLMEAQPLEQYLLNQLQRSAVEKNPLLLIHLLGVFQQLFNIYTEAAYRSTQTDHEGAPIPGPSAEQLSDFVTQRHVNASNLSLCIALVRNLIPKEFNNLKPEIVSVLMRCMTPEMKFLTIQQTNELVRRIPDGTLALANQGQSRRSSRIRITHTPENIVTEPYLLSDDGNKIDPTRCYFQLKPVKSRYMEPRKSVGPHKEEFSSYVNVNNDFAFSRMGKVIAARNDNYRVLCQEGQPKKHNK